MGGYDGKIVKNIEHCIEMSCENFKYRMLHHHCFDSELNKILHEYAGYKTIEIFVLPEDNLHLIYLAKV